MSYFSLISMVRTSEIKHCDKTFPGFHDVAEMSYKTNMSYKIKTRKEVTGETEEFLFCRNCADGFSMQCSIKAGGVNRLLVKYLCK